MGSVTKHQYITIDFLVVGAGPAGAALGSFMGQNGLKGLVISKAPSTADTPRAHLNNPFAIEALRDLDLEKDAVAHATKGAMFQSMRWIRSMVGEEYGKVYAWGAAPSEKGLITAASPCDFYDLPQSYLEPILVRYASTHGFAVRFSTHLINMEELPGGDSLCTIRDLISQQEYYIRAKYVFGADGAHSKVAQALGLKFLDNSKDGVACNIFFKADIEHLMPRERFAGLHFVIQPDKFHGLIPVMRLIRPWNQWILVCVFGPQHDRFQNLTAQSPEIVELIHQVIGDSSIKVEVQKLDPWKGLEAVAERYSIDGRNVFILGDAAHRHPPSHGNGSNTCIQDAYNLAWKVAYVVKGLAGPKLLESYSIERQPVGAKLVHEANVQFLGHADVWNALGAFASTPEEGTKILAELSKPTVEADKQRQRLHETLEWKRQETENLGLCMNQWYDSSAVYLDDETGPRPKPEGDDVVEIVISSYPGNRLPHAWLDVASRQKEISTLDLAGHGSFCLLIGHRGQAWREAADNIAKATGIPINTYAIGFGLDYIDIYRDWYKRREVEEDGCVLVRPDRFVAWRSKTMVSPSDCQGKLQRVLDRVLSREGLEFKTYQATL